MHDFILIFDRFKLYSLQSNFNEPIKNLFITERGLKLVLIYNGCHFIPH